VALNRTLNSSASPDLKRFKQNYNFMNFWLE